MTTTAVPHRVPSTSRRRELALATSAGLLALFTGVASFGLPSAIVSWFEEVGDPVLRTQFIIWGAVAGVLLPAAAIAIALRRGRAVASLQFLAAFVVAVGVALAFAFEAENATYAAMFAAPCLLVLALSGEARTLASAGTMDRPLAFLAAVATGPLVAFGIVNLRHSAAIVHTEDLHGGFMHAGVLALSLVAGLIVAALGRQGWRVVAAATATAGAMLGLAGVLFPTDPSSPGTAGGALLLGGAALVAGRAIATRGTEDGPDHEGA